MCTFVALFVMVQRQGDVLVCLSLHSREKLGDVLTRTSVFFALKLVISYRVQ